MEAFQWNPGTARICAAPLKLALSQPAAGPAATRYHEARCAQGYGTVRFKSEADVQRAIEEFNGHELEGRNITVKLDQFA